MIQLSPDSPSSNGSYNNTSEVIEEYENGNKIYHVILIEYQYDKIKNCQYGEIFTLQNLEKNLEMTAG